MTTAAKRVAVRFDPNFEVVRAVPGLASIEALADEVGVYSASPDFIRQHCGPIANAVLDAMPDWYFAEATERGLHPNADIRIHRLYPGDFPAYPGWHCDGELRETYFSQPDLDRTPVSKHIVCTVSSSELGVSSTQFLDQPFEAMVSDPESGDMALWAQVSHQINESRPIRVHDARDGELTVFDCRTLHRCTPAKIRGWRLFFRMSMWHRPNLGAGGKISRQEQVYKLTDLCGW